MTAPTLLSVMVAMHPTRSVESPLEYDPKVAVLSGGSADAVMLFVRRPTHLPQHAPI